MTDPISTPASLIGLIAVAGKITIALYNFIHGIKDAPHLAQHVLDEVSSTRDILLYLQRHAVTGSYSPKSEEARVPDKRLATNLTKFMVTFTELETVLGDLTADSQMSITTRTRWFLKKNEITELLQRLQNHKSSLQIILSIIQGESAAEFQRTSGEKISHLLESHQKLTERLGWVGVVQRQPSFGVGSDSQSLKIVTPDHEVIETKGFPFSLDSTLHSTRVYREAQLRNKILIGSPAEASSATDLPDLYGLAETLEISNLSILNLPIYSLEISNSRSCSFNNTSEKPGSPSSNGQVESSGNYNPTANITEEKGKTLCDYPSETTPRILEEDIAEQTLKNISSCIGLAESIDSAFLGITQETRPRSRKGPRSAVQTQHLLIQLEVFSQTSALPKASPGSYLDDITGSLHPELENILCWLQSYEQPPSAENLSWLPWNFKLRRFVDKYEDDILQINHYLSSTLKYLNMTNYFSLYSVHIQLVHIDPCPKIPRELPQTPESFSEPVSRSRRCYV